SSCGREPSVVLVVTPACNEAENLGATAKALAAQTCRPWRWVIVTNGCTDDTEEVADALARDHPWVRARHLGATGRRSFAAKAHAVAEGARDPIGPAVDFV